MNIKNHIIKHFIKFKVVHSIPGRLRLKVNNASKIPQEAKEYDKYVVQGLKMLDGIKDVEFNYITGSVVITYDTKKTYEEKIYEASDQHTSVRCYTVLCCRCGRIAYQCRKPLRHYLDHYISEIRRGSGDTV